MSPGSSDDFVTAVIELARSAGGDLLARRPLRGDATSLRVEHKGFRDLVTEADRESEAAILAGLEQIAPGEPVLSEERGGSTTSEGPLWIVDPLDGTTNYTHGHPLYAISIARFVDGEPETAVIHAPELGETWWARRGQGAYRDGHPIRVSEVTDLGDALLATGFSYARGELDHGSLEVFERLLREAREIRRGGSACLDLAHTATGVFGGFWEQYLQPHDVAAGALLIREAGGVVSDFRGGNAWLEGGNIVAGSPAIHALLLQIVPAALPPESVPSPRDP